MGITPVDVLATLFAYEDSRAKALFNAPYSGYQRIEASDGVLIVDTGRPPPPEFSTRAHAGTLSFEFSAGPQRTDRQLRRTGRRIDGGAWRGPLDRGAFDPYRRRHIVVPFR